MLALRGREGWESEEKLEEKEKDEVVGRTKGNGIVYGTTAVEYDIQSYHLTENNQSSEIS